MNWRKRCRGCVRHNGSVWKPLRHTLPPCDRHAMPRWKRRPVKRTWYDLLLPLVLCGRNGLGACSGGGACECVYVCMCVCVTWGSGVAARHPGSTGAIGGREFDPRRLAGDAIGALANRTDQSAIGGAHPGGRTRGQAEVPFSPLYHQSDAARKSRETAVTHALLSSTAEESLRLAREESAATVRELQNQLENAQTINQQQKTQVR